MGIKFEFIRENIKQELNIIRVDFSNKTKPQIIPNARQPFYQIMDTLLNIQCCLLMLLSKPSLCFKYTDHSVIIFLITSNVCA